VYSVDIFISRINICSPILLGCSGDGLIGLGLADVKLMLVLGFLRITRGLHCTC
jgi:hypothetical protein